VRPRLHVASYAALRVAAAARVRAALERRAAVVSRRVPSPRACIGSLCLSRGVHGASTGDPEVAARRRGARVAGAAARPRAARAGALVSRRAPLN
jgi:hypothetical protein